ncbi:hypothetical protein JK635_07420 [Neobacillus sp. YIM B02564]|uniref:Uncharacterized protein n=1 Tax=Neobacillus paridis TaxID=2803862 RepID=A0ABS1TLG9_9BACI|nr:hypothetical protein [Neobacillus paridis]MBL4952038.1 hypothetical protein [Neobacillus paridis]
MKNKDPLTFQKGEILVPNILVRSSTDLAAIPILRVERVKARTYELVSARKENFELKKACAHRMYMPIDFLVGQLLVELLKAKESGDSTNEILFETALKKIEVEKQL